MAPATRRNQVKNTNMTIPRRYPQRNVEKSVQMEELKAANQKPSTKENKKRLATPKIPMIRGEKVPMRSYLPIDAENKAARWPYTAKFQTIDRNDIGEGISESGKKAIEMGLQSKNKICCGCRPGQDCSTNKDCKCRKMADEMQRHFNSNNLLRDTAIEFQQDMFWRAPMFACSSLCSCEGKCKQNALQNMEVEQKKKFVVIRKDGKGFCLYTKKPITEGMPVASFNGEINGYDIINKNKMAEQYALNLCHSGDIMIDFIKDCVLLKNKAYKDTLTKAFATKMWVNPLKKGNCTRFLSHACEANLELARVFQGGLSPADARIVLFAKRHIKPEEELTFDYGKKYKKDHLGGACLCTTCEEKRNARKPRAKN